MFESRLRSKPDVLGANLNPKRMKVPNAEKADEDANLIRKQLVFDGNQGQGDYG